jgi:bifunctional ADP-heptose synthase (sugar kinase/adenylyltransferase)
MPIESQTLAVGGQVVTALCTCASLGLRTAYVGVFGDDEHGRLARRELEQRGVDISVSFVRQALTRQAVISSRRAMLVLWSADASPVAAGDGSSKGKAGLRGRRASEVARRARFAARS